MTHVPMNERRFKNDVYMDGMFVYVLLELEDEHTYILAIGRLMRRAIAFSMPAEDAPSQKSPNFVFLGRAEFHP